MVSSVSQASVIYALPQEFSLLPPSPVLLIFSFPFRKLLLFPKQ